MEQCTEVFFSINWQRAEEELVWKFAVCAADCFCSFFWSYLEIFRCHSAAVLLLLETDYILPACQYIIKIWPVWIAASEKIAFRLQLSGTLGNFTDISFKSVHHEAHCDDSLCAQRHTSICFISYGSTLRMRETKHHMNNWDSPLFFLCLFLALAMVLFQIRQKVCPNSAV